MDQVTSIPRTLRVFVASPSDVTEERKALNRLIRDINDVLAFLDPLRNLRIELVGGRPRLRSLRPFEHWPRRVNAQRLRPHSKQAKRLAAKPSSRSLSRSRVQSEPGLI